MVNSSLGFRVLHELHEALAFLVFFDNFQAENRAEQRAEVGDGFCPRTVLLEPFDLDDLVDLYRSGSSIQRLWSHHRRAVLQKIALVGLIVSELHRRVLVVWRDDLRRVE